MLFHTFGKKDNPVLVMLAGSFCPAESMENIYSELENDFYIIVPTYNGHYEGSKEFTTRQGEAKEIRRYLQENKIKTVAMIYGQSMGAEIGIELLSQLTKAGVKVENTFFDGAPCIRFSKPYKALMLLIFRMLLSMLRGKTLEEVMNSRMMKKFSAGDPDVLKPMLEPMMKVAPYITDRSIRNENECCYSFDFPVITEQMQKNMYFFYGKEEKAYKSCWKFVKQAYPKANYKIVSGYGHLTYAGKHLEEYVGWLRKICGRQ